MYIFKLLTKSVNKIMQTAKKIDAASLYRDNKASALVGFFLRLYTGPRGARPVPASSYCFSLERDLSRQSRERAHTRKA